MEREYVFTHAIYMKNKQTKTISHVKKTI